jgi:hypothetical protein
MNNKDTLEKAAIGFTVVTLFALAWFWAGASRLGNRNFRNGIRLICPKPIRPT